MFEIDVGLATVADKISMCTALDQFATKGYIEPVVAVGAVAKNADIHCDSKCEALCSETF